MRSATQVACCIVISLALALALAGCGDRLREVTQPGQLESRPHCLDFGSVWPGQSGEAAWHLRNVGVGPVELRDAWVDGGPFALAQPLPDRLESGEEVALQLRFSPGDARRYDGTVSLRTDEREEPLHQACLLGLGGGPRLTCLPEGIDLREVAVGIPRARRFRCENTGQGGDWAALQVESTRATGEGVRAVLVNDDGSRGADARGYAPGQGFALEATWHPEEAGALEGAVIVQTNEQARPLRELQVRGRAIDLAPCNLEVAERLDFGLVQPGTRKVLPFELRNVGAERCIVSDLRLQAEGAENFSLRTVEWASIGPGTTYTVEVSFEPKEPAPVVQGFVSFELSDPARPQRLVELRGRSQAECLAFAPAEVDFQEVAPACGSSTRSIRVVNTCDTPVEVERWIRPQPPFFLVEIPGTPVELGPNRSIELLVEMDPDHEGAFAGRLGAIAHGGATEVFADLVGSADHEPVLRVHFEQRRHHRADILWVIDNSGSMQPYQDVLGQGLSSFLHEALAGNLDFHLGVTTTGIGRESTSRVCPGGVDGGEDGRLFPVDGSSPRILDRDTPDLERAWAENVAVGTCRNAEQGLAAAVRAVTPPLAESEDDPRHPEPADGNAGFLRDDAHLAVVFLSDEDDQSGGEVQHYLDQLAAVHGAEHPELLSVHAIAGAPEGGCYGSRGLAAAGPRYAELVERAGGIFASVCEEDWSASLHRIGAAAFGLQVRFPLGNDCADLDGDGAITDTAGEITVEVNGTPRPSTLDGEPTWRYQGGEIEFFWPHVPGVGESVEMRCTPTCG